MQIFVAYSYSDRDKWVEQLVFPLIEAFGCEIATGKVMYGQELAGEVKETIEGSDALIAFLTRREAADDGRWKTHAWVLDEVNMAATIRTPIVEICEEGVETGGLFSARQQIAYREQARDHCLVLIAQAIGRVRERTAYTRLRLGPQEFVDQIRPVLSKPEFHCTYRVIRANKETAYIQTHVRRLAGSLYVNVQGVKKDDYVQIRCDYGDKAWSSDYERVDDISISLRDE